MCLLALAWQQHPDLPLLLAANRDEFHKRPTRPASVWPEEPDLIGGKDLEAGGSWLLANHQGRWATLTNVREVGQPQPANPRSRGELVRLAIEAPLSEVEDHLLTRQQEYAGFNLVWGQNQDAWYFSNRNGQAIQKLKPGIHLLSNAALNTAWPKTEKLRLAIQNWLEQESPQPEELFAKLADSNPAKDEDLPTTGVGLEWERFLSPVFICGDNYGTRASTLLWLEKSRHMHLWERSFNAKAETCNEHKLDWQL